MAFFGKEDTWPSGCSALEQLFSQLQGNPNNGQCVNCGGNPEWASVNNGLMVCLNCSGRHRHIGSHVSFIRSLTMDKWTPAQRQLMVAGGNHRFAEFVSRHGPAGADCRDLDLLSTPLCEVYSSAACRSTDGALQAYRKVLARRAQGLPEVMNPQALIQECAAALEQLRPLGGQSKIVGFGSAQPEPEPDTASQMLGWLSSGFAKAQEVGARAQDKLAHKASQMAVQAQDQVKKAKVKAKSLKENAKQQMEGSKMQLRQHRQQLHDQIGFMFGDATASQPQLPAADAPLHRHDEPCNSSADARPTASLDVNLFRDPELDDMDAFLNDNAASCGNIRTDGCEDVDQIPIAALDLEDSLMDFGGASAPAAAPAAPAVEDDLMDLFGEAMSVEPVEDSLMSFDGAVAQGHGAPVSTGDDLMDLMGGCTATVNNTATIRTAESSSSSEDSSSSSEESESESEQTVTNHNEFDAGQIDDSFFDD